MPCQFRVQRPEIEAFRSDFLTFFVWRGNCYVKCVTKNSQAPGEAIVPRFLVLPNESPRIEFF